MAAWLLACTGRQVRHGFLEALIAWLWWGVALVSGTGILLGITGGFNAAGFFASHLLVLAAVGAARRHSLANDWSLLKERAGEAGQFFRAPGGERIGAAALILALAPLTFVAMIAEPAVLDSLTYHLPRIGHWLQQGHMGLIGATDERLDFVASGPEVVMAWLVGGVREGFGLTTVAQAMGGVMMVGSTIGLARQTGLSRGAALLAGALPLGMANVVVQFTASQTDLFTTGVFAATFYLWVAALRRGEISVPGALGAGLALGAKGTLFYLAPGAAIWVLWLAWQYRLTWSQWRQTALLGLVGVALFALPGLARNWRAYGSALGPEHWVKKHHQGFAAGGGVLEKLRLNISASLIQNAEPQSQPAFLRPVTNAFGEALLATLPEKDPYTLDALDRRGRLAKIYSRQEPDADVVGFGVLTLVLFAAGAVTACVRGRRPEAKAVLVWSAGIVVFLLFFETMQQWHPYGFRYFLLVAPWIAVVGAWGVDQLGRVGRLFAWVFLLAATAEVGWGVTTRTHQAGWRTVVEPERSLSAFVAGQWRAWSGQFAPAGAPLTLALPEERPISAFYRQWPRREIVFKSDPGTATTAEDFVRGAAGWTIVPATRFLGREGRVEARVWLFAGDEMSPFSVAAYRTLPADGVAPPVLYRWRRTLAGEGVSYDLLVKPSSKSGEPLRLNLANPAGSVTDYRITGPGVEQKGHLAAGQSRVVEIVIPGGQVAPLAVSFQLTTKADPAAALPSVDLLLTP